MYLNLGSGLFEEALATGFYIDKTMLIEEANRVAQTRRKFMCVSRPRRFGKSMALEMLAAYFSKGADGKAFSGLKISKSESFERNLGKFNVLMLDLNSFYDNCGNDKNKMFDIMFDIVRNEFEKQFPDMAFKGNTIASLLRDVFSNKDERFVVLIDEYDVMVRKNIRRSLFDKYLEFLNGLFKNLDITQTIALAYLTGILPIVRENFQSKLNNFTEYTMLSPKNLLAFIGFTADEVEAACNSRGIDMEECKRWYDGYRVEGIELYSPQSVCELVMSGKFECFWSSSSSFEAISSYISLDLDGLEEDVKSPISGESIEVETSFYENKIDRLSFRSKNDVFTYCIHLGYLSYDSKTKTARIPNYEIRQQWIAAVQSIGKFSKTREIINTSRQLLINVCKCESELVAEYLEIAHREVSSNLSYNNEQSLQSAIMLAFIAARDKYTIIPEFPSGNGFADVALIPYKPKGKDPAIIIELKLDSATQTGLDQIRNRIYPASLEHCKGNMILVAISYDRKTKKHAAKVERLECP